MYVHQCQPNWQTKLALDVQLDGVRKMQQNEAKTPATSQHLLTTWNRHETAASCGVAQSSCVKSASNLACVVRVNNGVLTGTGTCFGFALTPLRFRFVKFLSFTICYRGKKECLSWMRALAWWPLMVLTCMRLGWKLAQVLALLAFCILDEWITLNTCGRVAGTHGDVLNVHTEAF